MSKWRVLAVDDEQPLLDLIEETLNEKYEVLTLSKAHYSMNVIELYEPDLVLLDIMMPKLNGFKIADLVKKNIHFRHVKVVFLTAKDKQIDIKTGYSRGADLYLTKPFMPDRLLRNIDLIFERTPPPRHGKKLSLSEVKARIEFMESTDSSKSSVPASSSAPAPSPPVEDEEERPSRKFAGLSEDDMPVFEQPEEKEEQSEEEQHKAGSHWRKPITKRRAQPIVEQPEEEENPEESQAKRSWMG